MFTSEVSAAQRCCTFPTFNHIRSPNVLKLVIHSKPRRPYRISRQAMASEHQLEEQRARSNPFLVEEVDLHHAHLTFNARASALRTNGNTVQSPTKRSFSSKNYSHTVQSHLVSSKSISSNKQVDTLTTRTTVIPSAPRASALTSKWIP
jgi:hypothetical protein